jgi:predicted amidohydrolase
MEFRAAAIQMTSNVDMPSNLLSAKKLIADAVNQKADLIVLPEMFAVMGVDQHAKVRIREKLGEGPIQDFLSAQSRKHQVWIVGGTVPLECKNSMDKVNAACLVFNDKGERVAHYKIHLFDVNIAETKERYFESQTTQAGQDIVVVNTPFGKMGLSVCYDIRFPEMFRAMHTQGVEFVAFPAAFIFTTGVAHWDVLIRARAIENQMYMIAAAQTGDHDNGRKTFGHSMIVDPWGHIDAILPETEGVIVSVINLDSLKKIREEFPVLTHRKM